MMVANSYDVMFILSILFIISGEIYMTRYTKRQIKEVVYHELGHWVVAREVGFDVGSIFIKLIDEVGYLPNHRGVSHAYPSPSLKQIEDVKRYIVDRGAVASAGVACQIHFLGGDEREVFDRFGEGDLMKIEELSLIYRGIIHPNETNTELEKEQRHEYIILVWETALKIIADKEDALKHAVATLSNLIKEDNVEYEFKVDDLSELFSSSPSSKYQ
ncbi:TPA: hypothetical protein SMM93_001469 [Proteus mirabilis]|uniref:hypothetical protein n=1 Tax=Proteus faecis TaxID=2050967 RepID=UPI0020BFE625